MSVDTAHDQSWSIWMSVLLLAVSGAVFYSAGSGEFSGNEVGPGFFPKIAAGFMALLGVINVIKAVRVQTPVKIAPRSLWNVLLVVAVGFVGVLVFQVLGMLLALFFLFSTLLYISEGTVTWRTVIIALVSTFIFHGFFVGFLGIFDPGGSALDLRWATPW